jgi:hypothetical protein
MPKGKWEDLNAFMRGYLRANESLARSSSRTDKSDYNEQKLKIDQEKQARETQKFQREEQKAKLTEIPNQLITDVALKLMNPESERNFTSANGQVFPIPKPESFGMTPEQILRQYFKLTQPNMLKEAENTIVSNTMSGKGISEGQANVYDAFMGSSDTRIAPPMSQDEIPEKTGLLDKMRSLFSGSRGGVSVAGPAGMFARRAPEASAQPQQVNPADNLQALINNGQIKTTSQAVEYLTRSGMSEEEALQIARRM